MKERRCKGMDEKSEWATEGEGNDRCKRDGRKRRERRAKDERNVMKRKMGLEKMKEESEGYGKGKRGKEMGKHVEEKRREGRKREK